MHAKDLGGSITEREARAIAANSMGLPSARLRLVAETPGLRVYRTGGERLGGVRAVERRGAIRVQRSQALEIPLSPPPAGRAFWLILQYMAQRHSVLTQVGKL